MYIATHVLKTHIILCTLTRFAVPRHIELKPTAECRLSHVFSLQGLSSDLPAGGRFYFGGEGPCFLRTVFSEPEMAFCPPAGCPTASLHVGTVYELRRQDATSAPPSPTLSRPTIPLVQRQHQDDQTASLGSFILTVQGLSHCLYVAAFQSLTSASPHSSSSINLTVSLQTASHDPKF